MLRTFFIASKACSPPSNVKYAFEICSVGTFLPANASMGWTEQTIEGSAPVKISDDREPLQWQTILLLGMSDPFHTSAIAESVTVIKMTSLLLITSCIVLISETHEGTPFLP